MTAHRLLLLEEEPSLARTVSDRLLDEVWGYDATPTTRTVNRPRVVAAAEGGAEPAPARVHRTVSGSTGEGTSRVGAAATP